MSKATAYIEPTGAQVIPYFNPAQPIKTNIDIMRAWLHNGWTWSRSTTIIKKPRRNVHARGTELFWYDKPIAQHFEKHTVLFSTDDKATANLLRELKDLMTKEANWEQVDLSKSEAVEDVLDSIFT